MSYLKISISLALKQPLPRVVAEKWPEIRQAIRFLKKHSVNIEEEDTTRTKYHICNHDSNKPCEPWKEI